MDLPKKIIVLDTETISLNKPFVYDIGYIVAELNTETLQYEPILKSQHIIEQIYDNKELFSTAYYEEKRKFYTNLMKSRSAKKTKLGYATQIISNLLKVYEINIIFAYNSSFDEKVFNFNSDYFKIKNPFKNYQWVDILGIANNFIHNTNEYKNFANEKDFVTEAGNIETNAEKTFAFLTQNESYKEEHTSLQDAEIELTILNKCVMLGFTEVKKYTKSFIEADKIQQLNIITKDKTYNFPYRKKSNTKKGIVLKL